MTGNYELVPVCWPAHQPTRKVAGSAAVRKGNRMQFPIPVFCDYHDACHNAMHLLLSAAAACRWDHFFADHHQGMGCSSGQHITSSLCHPEQLLKKFEIARAKKSRKAGLGLFLCRQQLMPAARHLLNWRNKSQHIAMCQSKSRGHKKVQSAAAAAGAHLLEKIRDQNYRRVAGRLLDGNEQGGQAFFWT